MTDLIPIAVVLFVIAGLVIAAINYRRADYPSTGSAKPADTGKYRTDV